MNPSVSFPDISFFIVLKWIVVCMFVAGLMRWTNIMVTKWMGQGSAGSHPMQRREDTWMKEYLANQKAYTDAVVDLERRMSSIDEALRSNGQAIKEAAHETGTSLIEAVKKIAKDFECRYNRR